MLLLIQTISNQPQIALFSDGKLLLEKNWHSERDEVARLLPEIETLVKAADKKFTDIKEIVVVNGVGAFSATRIGVTLANILAMTISAKLFSWTMTIADTEKLLEKFSKEWPTQMQENQIISPIYGTEPMITPSKKKTFN